ncbi:MAG: ATP phosphoribosyltransferase catalytic subunit HisG, partial [Paracoccaceae bacterium]
EGTIKHQTAEAIADITSSGETLRANHLRILQDGLVLKSQATLFRARGTLLNAQMTEALAALKARLQL